MCNGHLVNFHSTFIYSLSCELLIFVYKNLSIKTNQNQSSSHLFPSLFLFHFNLHSTFQFVAIQSLFAVISSSSRHLNRYKLQRQIACVFCFAKNYVILNQIDDAQEFYKYIYFFSLLEFIRTYTYINVTYDDLYDGCWQGEFYLLIKPFHSMGSLL